MQYCYEKGAEKPTKLCGLRQAISISEIIHDIQGNRHVWPLNLGLAMYRNVVVEKTEAGQKPYYTPHLNFVPYSILLYTRLSSLTAHLHKLV